MMRLLIFLVILFDPAIASSEDWGFESRSVASVKLNREVAPGEYNLISCSIADSAGMIRTKEGKSFGFCFTESSDSRMAVLKLTETTQEICLWQHTGYCDEGGMCESYSILNDCAIVHP